MAPGDVVAEGVVGGGGASAASAEAKRRSAVYMSETGAGYPLLVGTPDRKPERIWRVSLQTVLGRKPGSFAPPDPILAVSSFL